MKRVLILCTGNSCRSQMAEGLLRWLAGDALEVHSAGTRPSPIRPETIEVMREIGIDISSHRSKSVDVYDGQTFDYVITVCDNAREACPVFPAEHTLHHSFEDPADAEGEWEERLPVYRRVRDEIRKWLEEFVRENVPAAQ